MPSAETGIANTDEAVHDPAIRGSQALLSNHRQQATVDEVKTVQRNPMDRALVDQGADRHGRRVDDRRFRRHAHLLGDGGDTQLNFELAV